MRFKSEDIQHLADLARLDLSDTEKTLFCGQLSSILEYADKLQKLDISGVVPAHEVPVRHHSARPDSVKYSGREQAIMKQAPVQRDNFIIVPPVLSESDNNSDEPSQKNK
jgi:aspartyl-tRNA(Asn)/glutamyl-tRNA(Gln) amidotransferase subunit C